MADTKIIVNCETGEVSEVELTAEEIAQREADRIAFEQEEATRKAEAEAKAAKREAVLSALAEAAGLTVDDVLDVLA